MMCLIQKALLYIYIYTNIIVTNKFKKIELNLKKKMSKRIV